MGPFGMSATMLQRVGEKAAYNSLRIKVEGLLVQTKDNSKPQVFKVLLIEDNRIQAHQTQDWLEGTSFEVEWADGRVATVPKMVKKLRHLTKDFYPADVVDQLAAAITGPVDRPISDISTILRRRL